jgi:TPR repeat protein
MNEAARWRIAGIGPEARDLARTAAERSGVGVGTWLDGVIRRRTGLPHDDAAIPAGSAADLAADLPGDLLDTLDALEARIVAQANNVEGLVAPLVQSIDRLDERLRSVAIEPELPELYTTATDEAAAPFFASADTPRAADRKLADSSVAADLGRLFDDGDHKSDDGPMKAQPLPDTRIGGGEPAGRRSLLVPAAILLVILAVGVTLYQWAQVSTAPDAATDTATSELGAPAKAPGTTIPAPPTETVDLKPVSDAPDGTAATNATKPADPSYNQPAAPDVAETSPVGALWRGATAGDPRAQYDLGVLYIQGDGVPQDYAAASYWLRQAAIAGLAPAQYNLGVMYDLGLAGIKDPVEALLWLHAAADQDHGRAFYALGLAYAEGKGVPRNAETARFWFTKAAEKNVADGQLALGLMFEQGSGTDAADAGQAYYWFRRAELNGSPRAADRIAALGDRLTTAQRAAINDRVSKDIINDLPQPAQPAGTAAAAPEASPAPAPEPSPEVSQADTIGAVQALLAELGFDPGPADGAMGQRTRAAIEDYQRALGLPVDGVASEALLQNLRAVTGR